ncbi:CCNB1 protein, partial [Trogon melanurus]|nr:CCNB1 protein [Trogon melanurus]
PTVMGTSGCAPSDNVPQSQAFSDVLPGVEDTELKAGSDPNPCSVYVEDIYNYLRELEEKQPIRPEYLAGQDINGKMRARLIDWLVQVQLKLRLRQETLYTSVAIVDRFLQDNPVAKTTLQLVGVAAMFIASKYEDRCHLNVGEFASKTEPAYTNAEVCQMEIKILQALDFNMSRPIPLHFLRRTSKIGKVVSFKQRILAKYLMELSIMDYCMVHIPPSKIAAAALCLALKLLNGCEWIPTLQQYMTYAESDLLPVMQHMAKNVILVNKSITKNMTIKKKYDSKKYASISSIKQLDSCVIWNLAQPVMKK